jgi:uncharacterized RDD family membrane protein YckC
MSDQGNEDQLGGLDLERQPQGWTGAPSRRPPNTGVSYAEFPLRAAAFVLDAVMATFFVQLMSQAVGLAVLWLSRDLERGYDDVGLILVFGSLALTATAIYFWRVFRATPGQMLLGLFVVRPTTGDRLGRVSATARWLLLYAPLTAVFSYSWLSSVFDTMDPLQLGSITLFGPMAWYVILAFSVLVDRRGRGLHDRLAGSVVVRRAGPPA